jgi:hypothetical protein
VFSYFHGISWSDVIDAPTFRLLGPFRQKRLAGVECLAAPNASFDRSVLRTRFNAPSVSLEQFGISTRRRCPMSAGIYAFPCATTMPDLTRKHAHGFSLRAKGRGASVIEAVTAWEEGLLTLLIRRQRLLHLLGRAFPCIVAQWPALFALGGPQQAFQRGRHPLS